jgi:hypothetical protein
MRLLESAAAAATSEPDDAPAWFDLAPAYETQRQMAGEPRPAVQQRFSPGAAFHG